MGDINKSEAECDNFDRIWHWCLVGVFGIALIGTIVYACFFPEKIEEEQKQNEALKQQQQAYSMQMQSTEVWQVIYSDSQGKILRFLPEDTMFFDSRKNRGYAGYGSVIQLYDAQGCPLTYQKWKEQTKNGQ